jgi:hypothetical protein
MADLDMVNYDDMDRGYSETHCYTVTATDGENESDQSNEACATTNEEVILIDAPTNLTAVGGDGMISLGWDAVNADGSRADVTLWVSDVTDTNIEFTMNNTTNVYGFQFNILADDVLGATYGSASGGSSQDMGFILTNATGAVLGFSLTGALLIIYIVMVTCTWPILIWLIMMIWILATQKPIVILLLQQMARTNLITQMRPVLQPTKKTSFLMLLRI